MKILVTGGSGFLGRAIVLGHPEHSYVIYSPNVYNQQLLDSAAVRHGQGVHVEYVIGDVRNLDQLKHAARGCDAIIHAGAMKYVPEAELNVESCIGVNVQGSENVILAAYACGVPTVIGVSTDKACMPVSVYGATKLLMERMFINAGVYEGGPTFHTVRFGNFIGSTGSVVPKLIEQARNVGNITITDVLMTRYWMRAIDVADILVGLACQNVGGLINGSTLIPDPPALTLSGVVAVVQKIVSDKLHVETIGPRAGEKTHEMLLCHEESAHTTMHSRPVFGGDDSDGMFYEYHPDLNNETTFKLTSSSPRQWLTQEQMYNYVMEALQLQAAAVV